MECVTRCMNRISRVFGGVGATEKAKVEKSPQDPGMEGPRVLASDETTGLLAATHAASYASCHPRGANVRQRAVQIGKPDRVAPSSKDFKGQPKVAESKQTPGSKGSDAAGDHLVRALRGLSAIEKKKGTVDDAAQLAIISCDAVSRGKIPLSELRPILTTIDMWASVKPSLITVFAAKMGSRLPRELRLAHLQDVRTALLGRPDEFPNGEAAMAEYERTFEMGISAAQACYTAASGRFSRSDPARLMTAAVATADVQPSHLATVEAAFTARYLCEKAAKGMLWAGPQVEFDPEIERKGWLLLSKRLGILLLSLSREHGDKAMTPLIESRAHDLFVKPLYQSKRGLATMVEVGAAAADPHSEENRRRLVAFLGKKRDVLCAGLPAGVGDRAMAECIRGIELVSNPLQEFEKRPRPGTRESRVDVLRMLAHNPGVLKIEHLKRLESLVDRGEVFIEEADEIVGVIAVQLGIPPGKGVFKHVIGNIDARLGKRDSNPKRAASSQSRAADVKR